jgi:hypothetical protein
MSCWFVLSLISSSKDVGLFCDSDDSIKVLSSEEKQVYYMSVNTSECFRRGNLSVN